MARLVKEIRFRLSPEEKEMLIRKEFLQHHGEEKESIMTELLNLKNNHHYYRFKTQKEIAREKANKRLIWGTLALIIIMALYFFFFVRIGGTPPTIQEITPAERHHVSDLSKKHQLAGYVWSIDRQTGEIAYYRRGEWRIVR